MNQVYNILPDDRPVTSIAVVEDLDKCPKGYVAVSKTYDQDSDADLWRESGFFGRKCTRYLCLSKTEGVPGYVVQSLAIINEKEVAPQGYKTINKTSDSDLKAWRKKQICFKYVHKSSSETAVTDIIVLGKMKKAPEEFLFLGEVNGMTLCYKIGKNTNGKNVSLYPQVPYPVLPFQRGQPNTPDQPNLPSRSSENGIQGNGSDLLRPFRPAPKPPSSSYGTISGFNGLEGVPFILNPKFNFTNDTIKEFPILKTKTRSQIDEEYNYEFRTERET